MKKKSYITLTDQFCGAGGSSIGATAAGAEVRLAAAQRSPLAAPDVLRSDPHLEMHTRGG